MSDESNSIKEYMIKVIDGLPVGFPKAVVNEDGLPSETIDLPHGYERFYIVSRPKAGLFEFVVEDGFARDEEGWRFNWKIVHMTDSEKSFELRKQRKTLNASGWMFMEDIQGWRSVMPVEKCDAGPYEGEGILTKAYYRDLDIDVENTAVLITGSDYLLAKETYPDNYQKDPFP